MVEIRGGRDEDPVPLAKNRQERINFLFCSVCQVLAASIANITAWYNNFQSARAKASFDGKCVGRGSKNRGAVLAGV